MSLKCTDIVIKYHLAKKTIHQHENGKAVALLLCLGILCVFPSILLSPYCYHLILQEEVVELDY